MQRLYLTLQIISRFSCLLREATLRFVKHKTDLSSSVSIHR